jgi:hypothetical protein
MSRQLGVTKERFEKLLKRYKQRKQVAAALGCTPTYVSKLVIKFEAKNKAFWLTKGDMNV